MRRIARVAARQLDLLRPADESRQSIPDSTHRRGPSCRTRRAASSGDAESRGPRTGSIDHDPSRPAFALGLLDGDGAVEEGGDGLDVGAEVFGDLADGEFAAARREGQGQEDLVGGVGVDGGAGDGLEGEELIDGLVGDGLRRLAALAEADERGGDRARRARRSGRARPPAPGWATGPARSRRRREPAVPRGAGRPGRASAGRCRRGGWRHRRSRGSRRSGPRSVWTHGRGLAGSTQASSRPPPRG